MVNVRAIIHQMQRSVFSSVDCVIARIGRLKTVIVIIYHIKHFSLCPRWTVLQKRLLSNLFILGNGVHTWNQTQRVHDKIFEIIRFLWPPRPTFQLFLVSSNTILQQTDWKLTIPVSFWCWDSNPWPIEQEVFSNNQW